MSGEKILVTGGAGYIGSITCKVLHQAGYVPVTFDNLVYGHEEFVKWGLFEKGDITDSVRLQEVLRHHKPEAVVHFAAYAYVGESVSDPAKYYRNNVVGSLSLLEAMAREGVRRLVFSSSCAVYGSPRVQPIPEAHPLNPENPYGQTKAVVEAMLRDFDRAYGLKSISLRYFNAAGADPDLEVGEDHSPETHLIPLVLDVAAGRRKAITIFGNDYATHDGTCVRDYIHVTDLARAHVLALGALMKGAETKSYNLGTGKGHSVDEVIQAARETTRHLINCEIGARRPGDPAVLVADASAAMRELSWTPAFPKIEDILRHAWYWHQKRFGVGTPGESDS